MLIEMLRDPPTVIYREEAPHTGQFLCGGRMGSGAFAGSEVDPCSSAVSELCTALLTDIYSTFFTVIDVNAGS